MSNTIETTALSASQKSSIKILVERMILVYSSWSVELDSTWNFICFCLLHWLVSVCKTRLKKSNFNVKSFYSNLFSVFMQSNYAIVSFVENVHYSTDSTFTCKIALTDGDTENELKPYSYHRSRESRLCEFAERCRNANQKVKLFGKAWSGLTNVDGIEYADTKAIDWKKIDDGKNVQFKRMWIKVILKWKKNVVLLSWNNFMQQKLNALL